MSGEIPAKCGKPGCGALKAAPCLDWDCPQQSMTYAEHIALLEADRASAERIRDEAAEDERQKWEHLFRKDRQCQTFGVVVEGKAIEYEGETRFVKAADLERLVADIWSDLDEALRAQIEPAPASGGTRP